jgi:hypothetical protein
MQRRIGTWPRRAVSLAGASPAVAQRLARLGVDRFMAVHATMGDALEEAVQDERAMYRSIRLEPMLSSPATARRSVDTLIGIAPPQVQDAARIVVSELATNVVKHVQRPSTLHLALSPVGLLVAVTDASRQEPILRPVRADATQGRGLQLVHALSQAWGVRLVQPKGKTVWARIAPLTA